MDKSPIEEGFYSVILGSSTQTAFSGHFSRPFTAPRRASPAAYRRPTCVSLAATATADDGATRPDSCGSMTLFDQVLRDAGDERLFAFSFGGSQEDGGRIDLLANLVDRNAASGWRSRGGFGHDHLSGPDHLGLGEKRS
jgi:hypothetical protein